MKEFEGLPLFAKVVELKSFSEAGRMLGIPTTTVSRKIQQLETKLNGKLLNRTTRSISLTELGERVLPKARLIQDTLKELQTEAEEFSTRPVGKLYISAPRPFSQMTLAPLLARFRQQYPEIKIELDVVNRFQDLAESSLDFTFRIGELADSSLVALPLTRIDYELVANREWIKQFKKLQHPKELINFPTIRNHVEGYILPWHFIKDGESCLHQAEPDLLSDDMLVSVAYVRAGVGIACLPVSLIRNDIHEEGLIPLLPRWKKQSPTVHLVYPNRSYLPQKSKLFIEFIRSNREHFRELLTW